MSNINERLDELRNLIQDKDFQEGKGLSNEVNIRIFCYDPKEEMAVRHFMNRLCAEPSPDYKLMVNDLYQIFLSICEDMGIADAIPDMEESEGSEYLLEQLRASIGEHDFIEKMKYASHEKGDVVVLIGVGDVYPFMRVHSLLEAMQADFSDVPILVLYPGTFDGHYLKLFDRLEANDYYRGFNVI